ncbi:MAG: CHAT domain-containing protein [Minwuia sp.]|uniref:CHAT domain-containing protein n=1 Tax=Minwuia sp. TaxID=2493630 RepID=UPI003A85FDDF
MPQISRLLLPVLLLLAAGCTMHIETPEMAPMSLEPELSAEREQKLEAIDLDGPPPLPSVAELNIPPIDPDVHLPRTGEKTAFGLTVTPELEKLWRASYDKDWQYWNARLDDAAASLPDTTEARFFLQSLRIATMIHAGRTDDVHVALKTFRDMELELFGDNAETLSQYGQVHLWLNQPDKAIGYYTQLLADAGDWWIPDFFYGMPDNTGTVTRIAKAMARAYIGMAGSYLMKHDYAQAAHWAQRGLERQQQVIRLTQHPIWGIVVKADAHLYEGEAWLLTFLGSARIGLTGDDAAQKPILDWAKAYFEQSQYLWSELVVDSISDYVRYDIGLIPQETNVIGVLPAPSPVTAERLATAIKVRPDDLETREEMTLPVPASHTISLPGEGQANSFDFEVTPTLAAVNEAFIAGDYEAALAQLDRAAAEADDSLERWFVSYSRARTLIAAGRAADAEAMLPETEALEIAYFGTNLGARSLRGEARFWLGDYEAAIRDELQVVEALGDFRAPTLFVFPPQIPQLALMNRSQFRAYMVIANALIFQGEYERALPWAEAAEQLFEEAHYSWQHQLYSAYLKIDRDMFFARGLNLAIIGAARMQEQSGSALPERLFDSARAYLTAMGYEAGIATVDAVRARALIDAGRPAEAAAQAANAARRAAERGQAGILWQLQALQGEALMAAGKPVEAEKAFRSAQLGIDAVSGALATDGAKRRFGVGKEGVTRALVELDLARGDLGMAFADLERGRARAFVDMLGQQRLAAGRQDARMGEIRNLSEAIRRQRAINAAPGMASSAGVERVSALLDEREVLLAGLRRDDPELADAVSVGTPDLKAVQRRLGSADRLLYALPAADDDAPMRFLDIRRNGVSLYTASIGAAEIEKVLIPFSTDDPLEQAPAQQKASAMLSRSLGLDADATRGVLYVVPSGPLYFVPWGALDVGRPVVVLPTGGWLTRSGGGGQVRTAVVVGDPQLGLDWEALPGARAEAQTVSSFYSTRPLIGAEAQEGALRQRIGKGVGVLHLATHGLFDARDPLASAILLSDGDGQASLTASRLFEAPLAADLVVLSACETGLGQAVAGDDFLGLARSFYLGGARAVMNSLWPVHDKPTRVFMEVFHREARTGDYGGAWLAARDRLKAMGLPPSVYGAFVLGGAAGA